MTALKICRTWMVYTVSAESGNRLTLILPHWKSIKYTQPEDLLPTFTKHSDWFPLVHHVCRVDPNCVDGLCSKLLQFTHKKPANISKKPDNFTNPTPIKGWSPEWPWPGSSHIRRHPGRDTEEAGGESNQERPKNWAWYDVPNNSQGCCYSINWRAMFIDRFHQR